MKKNKGQSLLEMVIIIGVTGVALVAIALASTLSVRNARVSRERSTARNYALEVMEEIRAERKLDPQTFFAAGSRVVTLDPIGTNPTYNRQVTYTETIPGEQMRIIVEITWEDGGDTFSVVQETSMERYIEN